MSCMSKDICIPVDSNCGILKGRYNGGYYKDTYVFNTDTKTYQFTGYLESGDANAGMRWVGCTLKPEDQNVVMCAGGSNDDGSTNRYAATLVSRSEMIC